MVDQKTLKFHNRYNTERDSELWSKCCQYCSSHRLKFAMSLCWLQIAYSEELHTYLKTTGLHASDLVKPKPKKNPRDRSGGQSTSQLNHPQQHVLSQAAAGGVSSLPAASAASTLTTAGQQLIQTLLGLQPSLATSAAGDATAALAQAWAGQPVQQVVFIVMQPFHFPPSHYSMCWK